MHTPPRQDVVESRQQSRIFIRTDRHEGAGSHDALPTRCLLISIALGAQFALSNCMDCRASRPSPYARAMPASAKRAYGPAQVVAIPEGSVNVANDGSVSGRRSIRLVEGRR
jgi:hypothetical protein